MDEQLLRHALNAIADDVADAVPRDRLPPPTRRRARRRMVSVTISTLLALGLIAYGGVFAVGALTRSGRPGPAGTATCTWAVVPSPNVEPATESNRLTAVTAASEFDVWAVGDHYVEGGEGSGPSQPLIEHWDGKGWSIVPSPGPGGPASLQAVAALSANDAWAVGYSDASEGGSALIEHWDGTKWTLSSTPATGHRNDLLNAVAVVSADDVWAVGGWADGHGKAGTLTMHWDGFAWSVVDSPDPAPDPHVGWSYPSLNAVVATATDEVWAVGVRDNLAVSDGPSNTLVLRWDGSSWQVVASPDALGASGKPFDELTGLVAYGGGLWAVGSYGDSSGTPHEHPLVERWAGSQWSLVNAEAPPGRHAFQAVTATGASDAWAVGASYEGGGGPFTFVERWDGSSWTIDQDAPHVDGFLHGAASLPTGDVWTVGFAGQTTPPPSTTLVIHRACGSPGP
jgi:hypothetical protein